MKRLLIAAVLLAVFTQLGLAQNTDGRWVLGLHGGANIWMNDLNKKRVGPEAEMMMRYGISRSFSLGFLTGWELLKAKQVPTSTAAPYAYLKADGIPFSVVAWYHFLPGSTISPYAYVGAGAMIYRRETSGGRFAPSDKYNTTLHIPAGLGVEAFVSKSVAFNLDLGIRVMDDYTDFLKKSGNLVDNYATAKAGLNFYLGRSRSDDDDGDGLTNGEEEQLGTDPSKPDTDRDGLTDGDEVKTYNTSPVNADTDGDGLKDGDEVKTYKTNPNKPDSDGDGLRDGDEVLKHNTNPLKTDTDGDGLTDGDEVLKYKTSPLKTDTDGDGLSDADEVLKYKTDPLKVDTDGGTVSDATEITRGTNPLDPSDDVPKKVELKAEVGKAIVLEGVVFKTGKSEISPASEDILTKAYNTLEQNPEITVEIQGHTDNVGKRATNMKLSLARANAVKAWLVKKGIATERITTKGIGPDQPIESNKTAEGRQKNRRIEFLRTK